MVFLIRLNIHCRRGAEMVVGVAHMDTRSMPVMPASPTCNFSQFLCNHKMATSFARYMHSIHAGEELEVYNLLESNYIYLLTHNYTVLVGCGVVQTGCSQVQERGSKGPLRTLPHARLHATNTCG